MIASDAILKKKYIICNRDPILLALKEHLDIEQCGTWGAMRDSERIPLLYNTGVRRPKNREMFYWLKEQGRPVYSVERGSLPNTAMIDPNGMLAESCSYEPRFWDKALTNEQRRMLHAYLVELRGSTMSLEKQVGDRLPEQEFRKEIGQTVKHNQVIFVVAQKPGDTTILMWSDWVGSVDGFKSRIAQLASDNPDVLFLYKPHPLDKNKTIPSLPNVRNATVLHYKDCLSFCDKVFLINSGVGCQALAWQTPTYIFGKAHYHIVGANKMVRDEHQMKDAIAESFRVDKEKAWRYLYWVKFSLWSDCDLTNGAKQCRYSQIRMIA